jgi:hypothetical protein
MRSCKTKKFTYGFAPQVSFFFSLLPSHRSILLCVDPETLLPIENRSKTTPPTRSRFFIYTAGVQLFSLPSLYYLPWKVVSKK